MKKTIIIIITLFSLSICLPGRRIPNYNEKELKKCLQKLNLELNEQIEELRDLYDSLRKYVFNKKFKKYKLKEEIKDSLSDCFKKFGLKRRFSSPSANCHDICEDKKKEGKKCSCPHY